MSMRPRCRNRCAPADQMDAAEEAAHPLAFGARCRAPASVRRDARTPRRRKPSYSNSVAPSCTSGGTTGISAAASSSAKPCSSWIAAHAPALRPIELGDQRRAVLDADLVDAVFVAVQREDAAVGDAAERLDRRDDARRASVGRKDGIGAGMRAAVNGKNLQSVHVSRCNRREFVAEIAALADRVGSLSDLHQ